ncbi:MAG: methionine--tRNA ligase [Thermoplasmata archaeon]|nr:methionine--tRNA ligase [Thermoplasmata archaeon]
MSRTFIGVAWPYANGPLHLGHIAGCYLPADIYARYMRLRGEEVLMVSGSDQHGTPITLHAEEEGTTPEEIAERYHRRNAESLRRLGISFDLYTKTHREGHFRVVQDIFLTLLNKGFIYRKSMESPYCPKCKRFLPDRYVEGTCPYCGYPKARGDQCDNCGRTLDPKDLIDIKCKICSSTPEFRETEHFYLKLSAFEGRLREWVSGKRNWRANTLNLTMNWLKEGLKDRPITRDITWGVPIPVDGYEDKRIYVWFDAVCGYLSASLQWAEETGDKEAWKRFWLDENTRHVYFLAKDNIPFHTIIWPAMLMGYSEQYHLPDDVPANEYLKLGGEQFSKSRGHALWLDDFLERYSADNVRFYLSYIMPENRDATFDMEEFVQVVNTELVGNVGNFIHRALSFTATRFGEVPGLGELTDADREMLSHLERSFRDVGDLLDGFRFKEALKRALELSHEANRYFSSQEPWKLIKGERERCGTVLNVSLQVVKGLLMMLHPFVPFKTSEMWRELTGKGIQESHWEDALGGVEEGRVLRKTPPPFSKIEPFEKVEEREVKEMEEKEYVTVEEFLRMGLVVGKVLEVKDHPKADKLYLLKVDIGEEVRQIVAGLKGIYTPEELEGKLIVIIKNLKPAKLRGEISEGTLLAAENDKGVVSILQPDKEIEPGAPIH